MLALLSAFAAGVLAVAPLEAPVPSGGLPKGSDLFGPLPRVLAAVGSGVGALVLIGGALLSAWRLWRGQPAASSPHRRALAASRSGTSSSPRARSCCPAAARSPGASGELEAFEVTLLTGISVLFVGFLVATSASAPPAAPAGPAPEARRPARSAQDAPQDLAAHPAR